MNIAGINKVKHFFAGVGLLAITGTALAQPVFTHPGKGETKPLINKFDYKMPTAMEFDNQNRPYMINMVQQDGATLDDIYNVVTLRDGQWKKYSFRDDLAAAGLLVADQTSPGEISNAASHGRPSIYIDEQDNFYAYVRIKLTNNSGRNILISAKNIGSEEFDGEFTIHKNAIPGWAGTVTIEARNSFNNTTQYPPLIHIGGGSGKPWPYTVEHNWSGKHFTSYYVISPKWDAAGNLEFGSPIKLSDQAGFVTIHSGGRGFAVTDADKSYVAYMVHDSNPATDPNGNNAVYVATIDRASRSVSTSPMLFDSEPVFADPHSTPTIAIDSKGTLHVQGGAHSGSGFKYAKSVAPRNASAWTSALDIGAARTYSELFIDQENNMHSMFRGDSPYKLRYHSGNTGSGFSPGNGILFADNPGCSGSYRIYYHTLHKDRVVNPDQNNRVYANWTSYCGDSGGIFDKHRILAFTEDKGVSWKIPTRSDFTAAVKGAESDYFRIVNNANGKCLDVPGNTESGVANGTQLIVADCGKDNDQSWIYNQESHQVKNKAYPDMCLDSTTQAPGNGSNVAIYDCVNHNNLRWNIDNGVLRNFGNNQYVITAMGNNNGDAVKQTYYEGKANQAWELRVDDINGRWLNLRLSSGLSSGKNCLDVTNGSAGNGTKLQLWHCNSSDAQLWKYDAKKQNFQSRIADNKCLEAPGGNVNNGSHMQISSCRYYSDGSSHIDQRFIYDEHRSIRSTRHQKTQVLDGTGAKAGDFVITHNWHGGDNQRWNGTLKAGQLPGAWVVLKDARSGKCLDLPSSGSPANGTKLLIWDCHGGDNQQWSYDAVTKQLRSRLGKCLDVPGGNVSNNSPLQVWDCAVGNPNQRFDWHGNVGLRPENASGQTMDATGEHNGAKVVLHHINGGSNQTWNRVKP